MFSSFPGSGLQQKSGGFCLLCRDVSADLMFAFEIFLLNVRSSRRTDLFPVFLGKDVCDPVIKESREHSGLVGRHGATRREPLQDALQARGVSHE